MNPTLPFELSTGISICHGEIVSGETCLNDHVSTIISHRNIVRIEYEEKESHRGLPFAQFKFRKLFLYLVGNLHILQRQHKILNGNLFVGDLKLELSLRACACFRFAC